MTSNADFKSTQMRCWTLNVPVSEITEDIQLSWIFWDQAELSWQPDVSDRQMEEHVHDNLLVGEN